jgi:hypothetical protein
MINFPNSPVEGQTFSPPGGPSYVYKAPAWRFAGTVEQVEYVRKSGDTMTGNLLPNPTGAVDLGSATQRWRTIYTSDLSLNNGIGDWLIVEGADDLFITNNRTGKKYKFVLREVEDDGS